MATEKDADSIAFEDGAVGDIDESLSLLIEVVDTGIGIPADKLGHVLEAFSQADQSTTHRFGGTGIGLTICQRLSKALGGKITVTSQIGQGSTFSVQIPVGNVDAATIAEAKALLTMATPDAGDPVTFASIRVLPANDNAVNREVLSETLQRLGAQVVCVEDGSAAVDAVEAGSFDVVLMDCSMPVMDGYDATRATHALERSADRAPVPVVALTAHVIGEHAQTWRNAGMTGYLTKPYTLQSLRTCIADALGAARLTPPSTTADRPDNDAITGKSDLFDRSVLDNIAEMQEPGDDFVERVVRLYATHAPRSLQTLLAVIPSGNAIAIAEAAHALRSLSRNIGAIRVGDLCTRLEAEARDEDLSNVEAHCAAIQQSMPATIAALTAELARGSGTSELQQAAG